MRKYWLCLAIGVATLLGVEAPSHAQYYSPYTYNNNAYLNYAIANQKAQATRRKARVSKRSSRSRRAKYPKRTRRYSRR